MPSSLQSFDDESRFPYRLSDGSETSPLSTSIVVTEADVETERQEYVNNCQAHARLTPTTCFFSGSHLDDFERYLRTGLGQEREQVFVGACPPTLHDFAFGAAERVHSVTTTSDLQRLREDNDFAQGQAQVLFMRGHVPPAGLVAIGATLGVHHEFFYDHISEFAKRSQHGVLSRPALPSLLRLAPTLRVYTLGQLSTARKQNLTADHLQNVRDRCEGTFGRYLERARVNDMREGASLLRDCAVHSVSKFSFEQDMSITVKRTKHGFVVLVWLDMGENLAEGPVGEELVSLMNGRKDETLFFPTVQHWREHNELYPEDQNPGVIDGPGIPQNVLHLHDQYGRGLVADAARCSSFYAASDLFEFAAASERERLNMLRSVIKDDVAKARDDFEQGEASHQNLLHNYQVLREHVERLQDNLLSIKAFRDWPSTHHWQDEDEPRRSCCEVVEERAEQLCRDFECLVRRARDLAEDCRKGSFMVVQKASMEDSKRSLEQAKEVEDLTRLAFLFIPLGFITSFFGMNFAEFGQGNLPIWLYFALAGPTLLCSIVLMSERLRRLVRDGPRKILRWVDEKQQDKLWGEEV